MNKTIRPFAPVAALSVALLSFALAAVADVDVQTLGGGRLTQGGHDYGNANGNTYTQAQFNTPWATALDSSGTMYMADRLNNTIRQISKVGDLQNSQTTNYINGLILNAPIGVVVDGSDNLYVLTSDNVVRKYNQFKNLVASNYLGNVSGPSAMTLAPNGTSLYICYTSGCIFEVFQNGTTRLVLSNCGTMRGIGVLPSGEIVVSLGNSSSFTNAIIVCSANSPDPANPVIRLLAGNNGTGFVDGTAGFAKFNGPHGLAVTVDGKVIVADRYNNRVRIVDGAGTTTTLYGIDPANWNSSYFPGWVDGSQTDAASREPVSVCISTNGLVFTTEVYYHLLREVTGSGLTTGTTGGGTNIVPVTVLPPTFTPSCGYYPQCQTITVNTSGGNVYYTTDGSEPTTNSFFVATPNNVGTFNWCNSTNSLTSLRMKSFVGPNSSTTVAGGACGDNEIGFTKDVNAGVGSTVVVPVVVSLQTSGVLKSLQFRVEVNSANGTPDAVTEFEGLSVGANDFISVVGPTNATITSYSYTNASNGRGLVVSATGTSGFNVKNYGVVAMLKITIPTTCTVGQSYSLSILYPSATSDGMQADVPMTTMPARSLNIQTIQYLAGDSSPGRWYNAGDFGDSVLTSSDVNNALYASMGIRKPWEFTDAFQAMDTYPETSTQIGDGRIRLLDWQTILFRSVGLTNDNWLRYWDTTGDLAHVPTSQTVTPHGVTPRFVAAPGTIWLRQAVIGSAVAANQLPGNVCSLPVYAKVGTGFSLAGLQFRATLLPEGNAPTPGAITFTPAPNITGGQVLPGLSANDIVCAWSLGTLASPLQNSNLIGQITFTVPGAAQVGQHYTLRFSYVDGAPDINTQYDLESFPGSAWVMSAAISAPSSTSDEWKINFFGSLTNALAADNVDADNDGVPNWKEYRAGTNPNDVGSFLHFTSAISATGATTLTWLSAPNKTYIIEGASLINATTWTTVSSVVGDGNVKQVTEPNTGTVQFYRIRLQP